MKILCKTLPALLLLFFAAAANGADSSDETDNAALPCIASVVNSLTNTGRDHPIIDGKMVWQYRGTCLWVTSPVTTASNSMVVWEDSSVDDTTAARLFVQRCQTVCNDAVDNYNSNPKRNCAHVTCNLPTVAIIKFPPQ